MSSDLGGEAGRPILREDLEQTFYDGETPVAEHLIGVETEFLPVDPLTGEARTYHEPRGVRRFFGALLERGFTDPIGAEHPTLLERDDIAVNIEPGGQIELTGAPVKDLHDIERELGLFVPLATEVAAELGFRLVAHGIQPLTPAARVPPVPKRRYGVMVDHFERHGGAAYRCHTSEF